MQWFFQKIFVKQATFVQEISTVIEPIRRLSTKNYDFSQSSTPQGTEPSKKTHTLTETIRIKTQFSTIFCRFIQKVLSYPSILQKKKAIFSAIPRNIILIIFCVIPKNNYQEYSCFSHIFTKFYKFPLSFPKSYEKFLSQCFKKITLISYLYELCKNITESLFYFYLSFI